jgi:hypothetical protein
MMVTLPPASGRMPFWPLAGPAGLIAATSNALRPDRPCDGCCAVTVAHAISAATTMSGEIFSR